MVTEMIAVVGASGKTGARVLDRLKAKGLATRALSRTTETPFDWQLRSTWDSALQNVDRLYVSYYPDLAIPQAQDDIGAFLEVAKRHGVGHIVLLSGRGEVGAERAEQLLITSGISWNIVRASWFMQNFSESFMLDGLLVGQLVLPHPKATEPCIDANDIADVAVAALTEPYLQNQLLEVTGPELLSFADCVASIARAAGRNISFIPLDLDTYLDGAKAQGLDDNMAWLIKELFANVLDGRNEHTTHTVERVLGRPARSFADYVKSTSHTGVWAESPALRA